MWVTRDLLQLPYKTTSYVLHHLSALKTGISTGKVVVHFSQIKGLSHLQECFD